MPLPPMKKYRFAAIVARNESIREKRSFEGMPTTREQELELTHDDVRMISASLPGRPLCVDHKKQDVVGEVISTTRRTNGDWVVEAEIPLETDRQKEVAGWIEKGEYGHISLQHLFPDNLADEVSVCRLGARPRTAIDYGRAVAASADTNSDSYIQCKAVDGKQYRVLPCVIEPMTSEGSETASLSVAAAAAAPPKTAEPSAPMDTSTPSSSSAPSAPSNVATTPMDTTTTSGGDDLSKELPMSTRVAGILSHANSIPTRQQRLELTDTISRLEVENLAMKRRMEEEKAAMAEMKEKLRAEVQAQLQAEQIAQQYRTQALSLFRENAMMNEQQAQEVVNAMSIEALKKMMAASTKPAPPPAVSPQIPVAASDNNNNNWLRDNVLRNYQTYKASYDRTGAAPGTAAAASTPPPPHPIHVAASNNGPIDLSMAPQSRDDPRYGMPIKYRSQVPNFRQILISASADVDNDPYFARRNIDKVPSQDAYEPGEGLNFNHGFLTERQREIFAAANARSYGHNLSIANSGLFSEQAIKLYRRTSQEAEPKVRRVRNAAARSDEMLL